MSGNTIKESLEYIRHHLTVVSKMNFYGQDWIKKKITDCLDESTAALGNLSEEK